MLAVSQLSLLKVTDLKIFFTRFCKNISKTFLKTFNISLGTTTSGICLVKSQGFVSFNAIEMI